MSFGVRTTPPSRVLFLATVAQGGGDVAFAARMCHFLHSSAAASSWSLALCVQAGVAGEEARAALAREFEGTDAPPALVDAVREAPVYERAELEGGRPVPPASSGGGWSLLIQGPLRLFSTAGEGVRLGVALMPGARLLTVREYGQGRFVSHPDASACHWDVSAGLAPDECGVWRLPPALPEGWDGPVNGLGPAALNARVVVVGYFRVLAHGLQLGRLLGAVLQASPRENDVTLLMPGGALDAALDGLGEHPLCGGRPVYSTAPVIPFTFAGREMRLHLVDSTHLRLPPASFRRLLARAAAAVVCGDASLNEAICAGTPFWFSADGHKIFSEAELEGLVRSLAASSPGAGTLPAALWTAVSGCGWDALSGADWVDVRRGFALLAHSILQRPAGEGDRGRGPLLQACTPTGDLGEWLERALAALLPAE
jgi:hypothetical protein